MQLARLAGSSTLFTAIGDDELGEKVVPELERHGVTVHAAVRPEPQRRGFTYIDSAGERTITVIGERLGPRRSDDLPWDELAEADGVYFVSGDAGFPQGRARRERPRRDGALAGDSGREAASSLTRSSEAETTRARRIAPATSNLRRAPTLRRPGPKAGRSPSRAARRPTSRRRPRPGPLQDAYGAGDSFAAGLTYGLAEGLSMDEAVALAARSGAAALSRRGAHGA